MMVMMKENVNLTVAIIENRKNTELSYEFARWGVPPYNVLQT